MCFHFCSLQDQMTSVLMEHRQRLMFSNTLELDTMPIMIDLLTSTRFSLALSLQQQLIVLLLQLQIQSLALIMGSREGINAILRSVGSMGVQRVAGVHPDSAFPMVAVSDAKSQVATKVPKAEQHTAKLTEEEIDVKS